MDTTIPTSCAASSARSFMMNPRREGFLPNPLETTVIVKAKMLGITGLALAALLLAGARSESARAQELAVPRARTVWDGVYTQEQAARGKALYTKVCADCHDEDLETPGDDMTSTLAGPEFMAAWNGLTADDLYGRIRNTMPIDHPATLPKQTILDVMAYMFRYNKFPAGNAELPSDTKMLKLITITWKPDAK